MTDTYSDTFNREDIRRVHASFAADYRIAAESTELRSSSFVDDTISEIGTLAGDRYLSEIHLRLLASTGALREASVYRVSTDASAWTSERPGDMYWQASAGDSLKINIFYSASWKALTKEQKDAYREKNLPGWVLAISTATTAPCRVPPTATIRAVPTASTGPVTQVRAERWLRRRRSLSSGASCRIPSSRR